MGQLLDGSWWIDYSVSLNPHISSLEFLFSLSSLPSSYTIPSPLPEHGPSPLTVPSLQPSSSSLPSTLLSNRKVYVSHEHSMVLHCPHAEAQAFLPGVESLSSLAPADLSSHHLLLMCVMLHSPIRSFWSMGSIRPHSGVPVQALCPLEHFPTLPICSGKGAL